MDFDQMLEIWRTLTSSASSVRRSASRFTSYDPSVFWARQISSI